MIKTIFTFLTILSLAGTVNNAKAQNVSSEIPLESSVIIQNSRLTKIYSSVIGQEYLIKVWLPAGYAFSERSYPTLYLLDGDHAFAMATDIVQYLEYGGSVPKLIIISPAYGSKDSPQYGGTNMRDRDFDGDENSNRYLRFLESELIPYVDSTFRTKPMDRTLWGYSLGGQFALHALFRNPKLFKRYIVVDGTHNRLFELEQEYSQQHDSLPVKLFLSEGIEGTLWKLSQTMQSRSYNGLAMEYAHLCGTTHFAVAAEGLTRGLKSIFYKSIFEVMLHAIETQGIKAAIEKYHYLKSNHPDEYNFGESGLNDLGYTLLKKEQTGDAIEIFKLNVSVYPKSSNVYDSLGEAYMLNGDVQLAIENYQRSLELDPGNLNAKVVIKKLKNQN